MTQGTTTFNEPTQPRPQEGITRDNHVAVLLGLCNATIFRFQGVLLQVLGANSSALHALWL